MHIYSLRVWDWPRACNCQEGEIFLVLFCLREPRLVGGGKRGGGRGIEINERLKKFTIRILLYFWFASKVQKNDDLGKKYRNKIVESVAKCFNIVLLGL